MLRHNRSCADDCAVADVHTAHEPDMGTDPYIISDDQLMTVHWIGRRIHGGAIFRSIGMRYYLMLRIGCDASVVMIHTDIERKVIRQG